MIETNNIAALRKALEILDSLDEAIDDIALDDWKYQRSQEDINNLRSRLEDELRIAEAPLITNAKVEEYLGRSLYS